MTNGGITNFEQWSKESFTSKKIQGTVFCDQSLVVPWYARTAPYIVKALKRLFFGALM